MSNKKSLNPPKQTKETIIVNQNPPMGYTADIYSCDEPKNFLPHRFKRWIIYDWIYKLLKF